MLRQLLVPKQGLGTRNCRRKQVRSLFLPFCSFYRFQGLFTTLCWVVSVTKKSYLPIALLSMADLTPYLVE